MFLPFDAWSLIEVGPIKAGFARAEVCWMIIAQRAERWQSAHEGLPERLERSSMFYPTSILVGADGNIVGVWEGYAPDSVDQIGSFIEDLLAYE